MTPCPGCSRHVRRSDLRCVHCGEAAGIRSTVAAALLGLAVACGGDRENPPSAPEALYGVPPTGPSAPAAPETPSNATPPLDGAGGERAR